MEPVTFDVTLSHDPGTTWQLSADLHLPEGRSPDTVQLLLPGLTYDRRYWTAPGRTDYVRHALDQGYAVLALDRLGTGTSAYPPADVATVDADVETVHQVVVALRDGVAGHPGFRKVVAVGHSLGSGIAVLEAARHHDLDALVLTSLLHAFGPLYPEAVPALHPTAADPVLAGEEIPDNYLTTKPGLRARLYEYADGIDPELSDYHERTKSAVSLGEGTSMDAIYQPEAAAAVDVPVLLVMGVEDRLFGGGDVSTETPESVLAHEEKFYTAVPGGLEAFVLPEAAHSLNLHRSAPRWYRAAHEWLARRVPAGAPVSAAGER